MAKAADRDRCALTAFQIQGEATRAGIEMAKAHKQRMNLVEDLEQGHHRQMQRITGRLGAAVDLGIAQTSGGRLNGTPPGSAAPPCCSASVSSQRHHPLELGEGRIGAGKNEVVSHGLGRQQAIEGIAVRHIPEAGPPSHGTADRQIDRR